MKLGLPTTRNTTPNVTTPAGGAPLAAYWLFAFAGVALLVAAAMVILAVYDTHVRTTAQYQQIEARTESLARRLSDSMVMYHRMLEGLSRAPDLPALFGSNGRGGLQRREAALAELFPLVQGLRLLEVGHDQTDLESDPPLSFASLALLRSAEASKDLPPLEIIQTNSGEPYLVAAKALRDGAGEPVGLIHVVFDAAPVKQRLNELGDVGGRVAIRQMVDGAPVTLFATSRVSGREPPPDGAFAVAGSQLLVAYWFDPDLVSADIMLPAGVGAAVILLAGVIIVLQYRRQRKDLEADHAALIHLVESAAAGRKPKLQTIRVRDFAYLPELLVRRLKTARQAPAAAGHAAAASTRGAEAPAGMTESAIQPDDEETAGDPGSALPEVIFRPYDICGVVGKTLTLPMVRELGRAIGSQAYDQGQQTVMVSRDSRQSGAGLSEALIEGITSTGRDVVDLGMVPVPVLYFATHFLRSDSGVAVTAGRNPPDHNGLKVVLGGDNLSGPALLALRDRLTRGDLLEGAGGIQTQDLLPDYIERIASDVSIARPLKVVVDCADGCAALVAPNLYETLGCDVTELRCEVAPLKTQQMDPSRAEDLGMLRDAVRAQDADLGLAFDADGDRIGVVDSAGNIVRADRLMMLLSADVLSRHPGGDVIFDVKCSRALASQILQNGGRPVMWKSGHALLKAKLMESGALLAGGWNGHIMFRERWYGFDDAMYVGARLMEILAVDPRASNEVFADFPDYVSTEELLVVVGEGEQYDILDKVQKKAERLGNAKLTTIDGLRAEFEDGWGLVRASNTLPALSFRFEADTEEALVRIQGLYRDLVAEVAPGLEIPF